MSNHPVIPTALLKDVSRSFYLTLRVLPAAIRPQIGLAYLLARATDTIADTEIVPRNQRLDALRELRGRIMGEHRRILDFSGLARRQGSPAERVLLERCDEAVRILDQFSDEDRRQVREVLRVITSGQQLDLIRFAGAAAPDRIVALQSDAELDDYTYRVAGCVGEFWTHMCRAHLFPEAQLDDAGLLANGVRFGKGLQLVNILRDVPADLRQGRCYLPAPALASIGMVPRDLLEAGNHAKFRPLYDRYLTMAADHLAAGWTYTNMLPGGVIRVRLACAWPILFGARTVAKLRQENVLDPARRVKISRTEVRDLMLRSIFLYPFDRAWRRMFARFLA